MNTLDRIKKIAKTRVFSIQNVSEKAQISRNNIYKWNKSAPNAKSIEKVAKVLDVSVDYLLGKDSKENETPKSKRVKRLSRKMENISEDDLKFVEKVLDGIDTYNRDKHNDN